MPNHSVDPFRGEVPDRPGIWHPQALDHYRETKTVYTAVQ